MTKATKLKNGTQVCSGRNFWAKARHSGDVIQLTFMTGRKPARMVARTGAGDDRHRGQVDGVLDRGDLSNERSFTRSVFRLAKAEPYGTGKRICVWRFPWGSV